MNILQVLTNVYTYNILFIISISVMQRLPKRTKIVTLFENVLWRPSLIFWGIKNNIEIRVFRFTDLKDFYCQKENFYFTPFFFKEVEYHLPDRYFQSDYKFQNIFFTRTPFNDFLCILKLKKLIILNPGLNENSSSHHRKYIKHVLVKILFFLYFR